MRIIWPVVDLYTGENQLMGIMSLASMLKRAGFESIVVEANYKEIRKAIMQGNNPVIIGFSTLTVHAPYLLSLNKKLKRNFRVYSIFGGPHPTFFPKMIQEEGVDAICRGEGEYAMTELVQALTEGRPAKKISNLWIKDNGKLYKNSLRPLIHDLDELPLPDHKIFQNAIPHNIWYAAVMASRGCPYKCSYCFNHVYREMYKGKGRYVRRRSVHHVLEELKKIRSERCYKFIKFADDIFSLSPEWLEEFCPKYHDKIGLPFSCLVRANHVDSNVIKLLKMAGCHRITMGIEAGDDYVRNDILKRKMARETIIRAANLIKDSGIRLQTANIVGIPGGSFQSDYETLKLNIECRSDYSGVTLMQPYYSTEIYKKARELGMIDDIDYRGTRYRHMSVLNFRDKREKRSIENLQKLFAITVEFPFLLPAVKQLVRIPAGPIYKFVFSRWVNYCQYFRVVPARIGIYTIWKRSKLYSKVVGMLASM